MLLQIDLHRLQSFPVQERQRLRQFTLPRMLRELGRGVFAGCEALEKLL